MKSDLRRISVDPYAHRKQSRTVHQLACVKHITIDRTRHLGERTFPDGRSGTPELDSRTELAKEARDTESDSLIDSLIAPFLWNSTLEKSSIKWASWSVFNLSPPDPTTRPSIARGERFIREFGWSLGTALSRGVSIIDFSTVSTGVRMTLIDTDEIAYSDDDDAIGDSPSFINRRNLMAPGGHCHLKA
ncbi:hypothetical protein Q3G72_027658 [Acer saccharum]|nr:hypothetical protein Q3G72_027658 [Acer saccharum]